MRFYSRAESVYALLNKIRFSENYKNKETDVYNKIVVGSLYSITTLHNYFKRLVHRKNGIEVSKRIANRDCRSKNNFELLTH